MQLGGNYTLNFDKLNADDHGLKNGFNGRFLSLETIFEHFLALALLTKNSPCLHCALQTTPDTLRILTMKKKNHARLTF